jgi:hypothetical protein
MLYFVGRYRLKCFLNICRNNCTLYIVRSWFVNVFDLSCTIFFCGLSLPLSPCCCQWLILIRVHIENYLVYIGTVQGLFLNMYSSPRKNTNYVTWFSVYFKTDRLEGDAANLLILAFGYCSTCYLLYNKFQPCLYQVCSSFCESTQLV